MSRKRIPLNDFLNGGKKSESQKPATALPQQPSTPSSYQDESAIPGAKKSDRGGRTSNTLFGFGRGRGNQQKNPTDSKNYDTDYDRTAVTRGRGGPR